MCGVYLFLSFGYLCMQKFFEIIRISSHNKIEGLEDNKDQPAVNSGEGESDLITILY
jgi:hypothetical protein